MLIALPNDTLGGAEQYLKMLCIHFANQGYEVDVLFLKKKVSLGWVDVEGQELVHQFFTKAKSEKLGLLLFLLNLWKLMNINYTYVFTSHVHLTGILGILCRLKILKKKYFVGRESTLIFDRFKGLKLLLFKLNYYSGYFALDLLICQTENMLRSFCNNLPSLSRKIKLVVIPNPISWEHLYGKYFEPISLAGYRPNIVAAGRLIPEKGFDVLLRSMKNIFVLFPESRLLIFGEGNERNFLAKLISELNLESNVRLMGFEKNLIPYFQEADLCVVSSLIEGFPNVLLQMMAKNVNIVSTLCAGGINEMPGLYTAEPGNVYDLEIAMKRCLASDNSSNRAVFDRYLWDCRIENFVLKIDRILHEGVQD